MIIKSPCIITSRLMPGIRIGNAVISIGYRNQDSADIDSQGRTVYDIWIDIDGKKKPKSYHITDLRSGCQGGTLQEGLASCLSFLSAAAESYAYTMRTGREGENSDLFMAVVVEWAYQHSDEISMKAIELEEIKDSIQE